MPTKIGIYSEQWLVGRAEPAVISGLVAGARKSGTQSVDRVPLLSLDVCQL